MINNVKDILPIGSIVLLRGGKKRLMIFGIMQSDTLDSSSKEYDYVSVPYPEGNVGPEFQFLFNAEDIETVVYRGPEDEERGDFLERLNQSIKDS